MVMSELRWHTASPEDNKNSLKRDLLKSTPTSAREAAVHIMQNRCKLMPSEHVKNSLDTCSYNHKNSKKIYNKRYTILVCKKQLLVLLLLRFCSYFLQYIFFIWGSSLQIFICLLIITYVK